MLAELPIIPPPRLRNKLPAVDLAGFFTLLQQAFVLHIQTSGAPQGTTPILVETFPKERLSQAGTPFDVITYRISNVTMAPTMNNGSAPRGVTLREEKQSAGKADYNTIICAWWEQVIVTFEVWSKDNATANTLAIWFHKFIFTWAFVLKYFQGRGISNFDFVERQEDTAPRVEEQEIYLRQLSYTFKLENLIAFEERQLTSITLLIDTPGIASINLPANSTK